MQRKAGEEEVFQNERRKLQVDFTKKEEVAEVSQKKRSNWQDIEEEKAKAAKELEEL
jgi:capsid portal protein